MDTVTSQIRQGVLNSCISESDHHQRRCSRAGEFTSEEVGALRSDAGHSVFFYKYYLPKHKELLKARIAM